VSFTPAGSPTSEELDLLDLFRLLWQQKAVIILTTLFAAVASLLYAMQTPQIYQAKASVLPPRLSDIAPYNLGRLESEMVEFKVSDVYAVFTRSLRSESLRRDFFNQVYLPALSKAEQESPRDALWARFSSALVALAPEPKLRPDNFEVRVESEDPERAAAWANLYVRMAAEKATKDMQSNVLSEIHTRMQALQGRIDVLRISAKQRREDRIARLHEALQIAAALGVTAPQVVAGRASADSQLGAFVDGDLMYMRGTKALKAELQALTERKSDDPYIKNLRSLQTQLAFLQGIDVDPQNVAVFTLDRAAEVPQTPTNPRKALILAVGVIIGGIMGVFMALIRGLIKRRLSEATGRA
jgi:chain length determinant protein (polysaccharide antigen chain regulator)